ncbi:unnamed protein product [Acanthoscelides obtectus]|uniref:DDE-1 domain-containing protein n=1 Tax=Acanthoscelides obtectus TaxID=200917 RepID=A0A9P0Q3Z0_ACAOB|nr:unnamed protein product [Acanthoscelides obtectus]CAK1630755.1 CENP-B homolog protein 2 [Acanthoscelides obtectus]
MVSKHCVIHRQALVSKTLPQKLCQTLDSAIRIDLDSDHKVLLFHTEVRWLFKGNMLAHLYELKEEFVIMGKYKRKSDRSLKFTQEIIDQARDRIAKGESKRSVAKSFHVNECTLRKRLREGTIPSSLGRFKPVFSQAQEKELADHIKDLDNRFYGLRMKDVRYLAFQYAELNKIPHRFNTENKMAGKHWVQDFAARNTLSLRAPEKCSLGRAIGFNKVQCQRFFENLKIVYEKLKLPPHRIFNMDETGLSTVPNKLPKVYACKGKKTVSKVVSGERGQLVTAVCCMSAGGTWVPPGLIFARKRMKEELFFGAPPGTLKMISDSGYMNTDLFVIWLRHFCDFVKPSETDPVVLIMDNHTSHCSLETILFSRSHFITLLTLPPHASHKIQPLDKGFFFPLKTAFSNECDKWMVNNPGRPITLKEMAAIFHFAYSKVTTIEICEKSFACTGLFPYNPDVFSDLDFAPSEVTNRPHLDLAQETQSEIQRIESSVEESSFDDDCTLAEVRNTIIKENLKLTEEKQSTIPEPQSSDVTESTAYFKAAPKELSEPGTSGYIPPKNDKEKLFENEQTRTPSPKSTGFTKISTYVEATSAAPIDLGLSVCITPKMILPLPKATHEQVRRTKSKKSEILSSTPYKDKLLEEKDRRKEGLKKKGGKRKVFGDSGQNTEIQKKKKVDNEKDNTICPGCSEHYSTSDWIKCHLCQTWWHDDCSNYLGNGLFSCDLCLHLKE